MFTHVAAVCACLCLMSNNRGEDRVIVEKIFHKGIAPCHPHQRNRHANVNVNRLYRKADATSTTQQHHRTPVNQDGLLGVRANRRFPSRQPRTNTVQSQVIGPNCRISNIDSVPHGHVQQFDGEAFNFDENEARINAIVDAGADHTMLSNSICVCLADTARKIQVDSLKLEQRIVFRTNLGHMRDHGYMTNGGCDIVETHVIIESPEPEENIKDLLNEAENGCMAHYALRNPIPWTTRLVYNGKEAINR